MKFIVIAVLMLLSHFFLGSAYADADFSVYAQNQSQSSIQELPAADQCSVITITIRELASALKKVDKDISLLEMQGNSAADNSELSELRINGSEQKKKLLHEKLSSLQKQMDMQEQKLENCLQKTMAHAKQDDLKTTQKKR